VSLADEFCEWERKVVEVVREFRTLLRCPVRARELVDGPEERIRQGLLHFLVRLSGDVGFLLDAERNRHDIDLHWSIPPECRPPIPPMLIVETKVDGAGGDWNGQLLRYLRESGGDCGVVFTGQRMWKLTPEAASHRVAPLSSLTDLAALIRDRAAMDPLALVRADFVAGCDGELDAIQRLSQRYRYTTFVLSIRGNEVACRQLRFSESSFTYRPATHHTHVLSEVNIREVERLVRIEP